MSKLWLVRLGSFGEQEPAALERSVLATGWQTPGIANTTSREQILEVLKATYPNEKPGTLNNWSVQLNQLKNQIKPGDLTITPLKTTKELAIGRVVGDYFDTADGRPARRVEWLNTELPRDALKQDLLFSLGASQTVCGVHRNKAAERLEVIVSGKPDPGYAAIENPQANATNDAAEDEAEQLSEMLNAPVVARGQIERHVSSEFVGHRFTELIAAILRAQGYKARVSPPGGDRSIDIVAGQGANGFDGTKLVVQVKSGDIKADQPTLQALLGAISDVHADHGLLVSWGGFTKAVQQRLNELYFRVRLWDRDEVLNAIFDTYDKLPEEIRADLPLKRIWTLVVEEDAT